MRAGAGSPRATRRVRVLLRIDDPDEEVDALDEPVGLGAMEPLDGVEVGKVDEDKPVELPVLRAPMAPRNPEPVEAVDRRARPRPTPTRSRLWSGGGARPALAPRPASAVEERRLARPGGPWRARRRLPRGRSPSRSPARSTTRLAPRRLCPHQLLPSASSTARASALEPPVELAAQRAAWIARTPREASDALSPGQSRRPARGIAPRPPARSRSARSSRSSRARAARVLTAWSPKIASSTFWPRPRCRPRRRAPRPSPRRCGRTRRHDRDAGPVDTQRREPGRRPLGLPSRSTSSNTNACQARTSSSVRASAPATRGRTRRRRAARARARFPATLALRVPPARSAAARTTTSTRSSTATRNSSSAAGFPVTCS